MGLSPSDCMLSRTSTATALSTYVVVPGPEIVIELTDGAISERIVWREVTKRLALPEICIIGPPLPSQPRDDLAGWDVCPQQRP